MNPNNISWIYVHLTRRKNAIVYTLEHLGTFFSVDDWGLSVGDVNFCTYEPNVTFSNSPRTIISMKRIVGKIISNDDATASLVMYGIRI